MTPFGEKLLSLREQRGWTQKKMAEKLGGSAAFLSALENGQRGKPSRRLLHAICQTFGIIWDEADALADLARQYGWTIVTHRTDKTATSAVLALYRALARDV